MELNNIDHNSYGNPDGGPIFRNSVILYVFSWVCFYLQVVTADTLWTWAWRILSAISLLLIIYINWNKAVNIFKNNKRKKDKN